MKYTYQKPNEFLATGLLLLGLASPALAQTPTFQTATTYSTGPGTSSGFGSNPNGLVAADVNGDGKLDLLTTNFNTFVAAVLLGKGDGTFQDVATYFTGTNSNPRRLAVADVNSDGKLDLLTANQSTSTAGVLLGNGNGTFRTVTTYPVGAGGAPADIAVADVNGDGKPDLLTANNGSNTAGVLLGNGNGTFQTPTTYSTGAGSRPFGIVAADVNGDGKLDLLTANFDSKTAAVLLGNGDGTFQTVTTYAVGTGNTPADIAVADINGDGKPDLLTANYNTGTASVLLGNGNGTFQTPATYSTGASSRPFGIAAADINGDGKLDLLTASGSGTAGALLGSGDGTFQLAYNYSTGPNSGSSDIAVADVNGDKKLDLLTANSNSNTVGVLLNTTTASIPPTLTNLSPASGPVGSIVTLMGTDLGGTTAVKFNGVAATTVTAASATRVTAVVPAGASTGPVSVTTGAGTVSGPAFTITYPDLVVSTTTSIAPGTYNSITVTSTGNGTLAGGVVVNSTLEVQAGGTLTTDCQPLTGAGSFKMAAGATLGICDPAGIMTTGNTGAVQVTGTRFFSPDASYVYNGTVAQVTGDALPAQVRNLTTTNAKDVTLSQGVAIAQVLTISDRGDLVQPSAAASITLLSDATTGTALMVNKFSGALQGATTTIQRAIDGSTNAGSGYRHFAPPVYGATIGSLTTAGFTPVVNSLYNTKGTSVQPFPTVYFYDERRVSDMGVPGSGFDKGWVSPDDLTDQLFNTQGYTLQLPATVKLSVTGRVFNNGGVGLYLYRTGSEADAGWSLVGNPYASPIDWSLVTASDREGLDAAMYVFESTGPYTGSYRSYANGIGGNPIIPMGQAFFVRVSSDQTQGMMFFMPSQRVTTFNTTSFKRTTADPRPQLALSLTSATLHDITYLYQEAGATTGVDAEYDAVKMSNSNGLNLSQLATTTRLAINGLPTLTSATTVPLVVGVPAAGTYTLAPTTLSNLPAGLDAYLRDAQTGRTVKLAAGSSYSFDVTATQAATPILGRFTLQFSPATPLATAPALAPELVGIYPNPAHGSFTVTIPPVAGATQVQAELLNSLGQVVRQHAAALPPAGAQLQMTTAELPAGVYVLRLQAGPATRTKQIVVY
jgi:hypothetical protein